MPPIVAIVGRANVGKSRLFNRLVGYTKAIVADVPGITRDRHYAKADWAGREFVVIDTGGCEFDPTLDLEERVTDQSLKAVAEADVVVLLFDGQHPPLPSDEVLVKRLRRLTRPVIYAVNKIDSAASEGAMAEFTHFGAQQMIPLSAEHGRGVDDLLEVIVSHFPAHEREARRVTDEQRIAVIGRPNVGKSTLINRLAGEERVIAHELPGTTRDAIDVEVEAAGRRYLFIDTAGIRRGSRHAPSVEKRTTIKSLRAVDRADIACQLIDGSEGLTHGDLELASYAYDQGKGLIFLVNKWDLVTTSWKAYAADVRDRLQDMKSVPLERISAQTGFGCQQIFPFIDRVARARARQLTRGEIASVIAEAVSRHHLPVCRGHEVVISRGEQTGIRPPTFTLFTNFPQGISYASRRYLMHCLSTALGADGIPIRLVLKRSRGRR